MSKVEDAARKLADELLASNSGTFQTEFTLRGSTDRVIVVAARVASSKRERVAKSLTDSVNSISLLPNSSVCPTCGR